MIVTNIDNVPGRNIVVHYGLVSGSTVRAKIFIKDFFAAIRNIFGGEIKNYTELLEETRKEAIQRMIQQAESFGADAIVNVRFSTSSIAAGAAEIYVYGTAVKIV